MIMMIAFEAAIFIYILLNEWDDARYYFGLRAAVVLLTGILLNLFTLKKVYPWIKYYNNLVMILALFFLGGYTDIIAMLFILLPLFNSFYFRPYFTVITGLVCLIMLYVCMMSIATPFMTETELPLSRPKEKSTT